MFLLKQSSQLTSCFGVDCINVLNSSETSFSFSIRRASLSSGSSFSLLSCVSFSILFNFSHLVIFRVSSLPLKTLVKRSQNNVFCHCSLCRTFLLSIWFLILLKLFRIFSPPHCQRPLNVSPPHFSRESSAFQEEPK